MKTNIRGLEFLVLIVILIVGAVLVLPVLRGTTETEARRSCANNLKQLGLVLKMYANESRHGKFPPVSLVRDNWIIDMDAVYPEYMNDLSILIDPASPFAGEDTFRSKRTGDLDPDCVSGLFYNYTGFLLTGDANALALYLAYESMSTAEFSSGDHKIGVPVWKQKFPDSGMAVMWDRVPLVDREFAHQEPLGGHVLIMDGHVEFVKYSPYNNPSFFPMTRVGAETFGSVQPRLPGHCFEI